MIFLVVYQRDNHLFMQSITQKDKIVLTVLTNLLKNDKISQYETNVRMFFFVSVKNIQLAECLVILYFEEVYL